MFRTSVCILLCTVYNSQLIYNLVRGLSKPYSGAHISYNGKEEKIWKTRIGKKFPSNIEPGKILEVCKNGNFLVKTGDGSMWIIDHRMTKLPMINSYLI